VQKDASMIAINTNHTARSGPSARHSAILAALGIAACSLLSGCVSDQQSNASTASQEASLAPNTLLATNTTSANAAKSAGAIPEGPMGTDGGAPANNPLVDLTEHNTPVWAAVAPSIINTNDFPSAIQDFEPGNGPPKLVKDFLPKHTSPRVEMIPPNDLVVDGTVLDTPRARGMGNTFDAISDTGFIPPDPSLAVGPEHIVQVVNSSIAFFNKGGSLLFQAPLGSDGNPGFLEDVGAGDFAFDPKAFYDHISERFVIVVLEVYGFDPNDPRDDASFVTIAVSDDDDPNGTWFKYRTNALTAIGDELFWWDYPGFGYDEDAWYVNCNLFNIDFFGDPGFAGVGYRIFDKNAMLNGEPAVFSTLRDANAFSMQGTSHYGENQVPYFFGFNNSNTMRVSAIEDPITNPSVVSTTVSVPAIGTPNFAQTAGGGSLDTVRLRIMNVHWRDGSLYGAHAIGIGSRNVARWYEINTNNWPASGNVTLAQSGNVDLGGDIHTFFPAIMSNDLGEVAMVMGRTAPDELISFIATARAANDPAGFMGQPIELGVSPVAFYDIEGFRWGDYYDIALDPSDGVTFWGTGQIQLNTDGGGGWGTLISQVATETSNDELVLTLPQPLPNIVEVAQPVTLRIRANPGDDTITQDPQVLVLANGITTPFEMELVNPNNFTYEAVIPAPTCNKDFTFSFIAAGESSGTVQLPDDGSLFFLEIGEGQPALVDTFQNDLGWTVSGDAEEGIWERGVPLVGGDPRGAPTGDANPLDGEGFCYLTDNTLGNTDVDGGATILTSPNIEYEGSPTVSYSRWFHTTSSTDPDGDAFVIELSHDNGTTWTTLETVGPGGPETSGGWISKSFNIGEFVPITGEVQIRFIASDDENPSVIEAGLDSFELTDVICCPADWNFNGQLDVADFVQFVDEWNNQVPRTDIRDDDIFNILDVIDFFFLWSLGCEGEI
jgi:hypothetical protein